MCVSDTIHGLKILNKLPIQTRTHIATHSKFINILEFNIAVRLSACVCLDRLCWDAQPDAACSKVFAATQCGAKRMRVNLYIYIYYISVFCGLPQK